MTHPECEQPGACVHLHIRGRVQGVGFRYSTQRQALLLGLTGWVRNCLDGSVEALAEGDRQELEQWIDWCRHGPPGAHVTALEVEWRTPGQDLPSFEIRA